MISHTMHDLFRHHPPIAEQIERYGELRRVFEEIACTVQALTPASEEQDLAIRALHLALMHANSAIALNEPD